MRDDGKAGRPIDAAPRAAAFVVQLWPLCLARVLAFFAAAMTVLAPQISAGSGIAAAGVAEFVRERGEDLVGDRRNPWRRGVLTRLSRGTGVQVKAIFDVRALLTPPLAAERIVKQSRNCALIP